MTDEMDASGQTLNQAMDRLGETANRIADQLIACRELNREWCKALQDIAAARSLDEARLIAAKALDGPE